MQPIKIELPASTPRELLIEWRDQARRRSVPLDRVKIVAGDQIIDLKNTDAQTLVRVLEGLRDRT